MVKSGYNPVKYYLFCLILYTLQYCLSCFFHRKAKDDLSVGSVDSFWNFKFNILNLENDPINPFTPRASATNKSDSTFTLVNETESAAPLVIGKYPWLRAFHKIFKQPLNDRYYWVNTYWWDVLKCHIDV